MEADVAGEYTKTGTVLPCGVNHRELSTDGKVMIWEYPRARPDGEQTDMAEVMALEDGLIKSHRIYWGWKGTNLLRKDQYRIAK
ncbi:MAG: hypothetical protein AB7G15_07635 [Alphaproteobacteria bacterium]